MKLEQLGANSWVARSTFEERALPKSVGFRWNPAQKIWWTDDPQKAARLIEYADEAVKEEINNIEQNRKAAIESSKAVEADIEIPVPEGLSYLPYQRAGIAYASSRQHCLIGDEMGLGKTIQAIGIINADSTIQQVLVVCPASLKINWHRELNKWLTRPLSVSIANGDFPDSDIVIINYDILKKYRRSLRSRTWGLLVCDEAHYLKNPKAQRTNEVLGKYDKDPVKRLEAIPAIRKVYLTGTPIANRPIELWPILKSTGLSDFQNWKHYVTRYCAGATTRFGWDVSGASNLGELQEKLRSQIMVRRLKKDVLTDLPAKRRQIIELPVNGAKGIISEEAAAWQARKEIIENLQMSVELAKAGDKEAYDEAVKKLSEGMLAAFTEMSKIRHETALAKVEYVVEHVAEAVDSSGKVVLFGHHKDVLYSVKKQLEEKEIQCVTLTGDMGQAERQVSVDRFQTDPNVQVFIGTIGAAGVGITLTAASHVVFAELDWVPGNLSQAEDRCHRIGQKGSVLVQHLVLDGSLDATIAKRVVEKQNVIDSALDTRPEIKSEPIIPFDPPATSKKSRHDFDKLAEEITSDEIEKIHRALQILAGLCDGARSVDGMGFNKIDAGIGRDLAARQSLTPRQAALGKLIARKYSRQIGEI